VIRSNLLGEDEDKDGLVSVIREFKRDLGMIDNEVYDEADLASIIEEMEREYAIRSITSSVPKNRDIESLLADDAECDFCGALIPIIRQRIVLSIADTCDYCVECQEIIDRKNRLFA
jgi:RNA polymerase-binding transcription factor DksA